MLRRRILGTVAGAALVLGVPALAASASSHGTAPAASRTVAAAPVARAAAGHVVIVGGQTMLALNPATAGVLTKNGVHVSLAAEARATRSGISFPISGGVVSTKLVGTIKHTGGLTFRAGGRQLTVRDFTINTRTARLTAYVDQAKVRIPLLDLSLAKAKVTTSGHVVTVANVAATLDATAAKALDSYFHTTLFTGGIPIGTARVQASVLS